MKSESAWGNKASWWFSSPLSPAAQPTFTVCVNGSAVSHRPKAPGTHSGRVLEVMVLLQYSCVLTV